MTVQAPDRRRFGFQQPPVVTAVVFVVTATTSVLGLLIPGMLEALQRTAQGLHGDWWRTFTALFVQDGGVVGTLSNLAFLLVMGVLAEQVVGAWRWLVGYFGAGLAGELVGYAWQPRGAGNSVAICGLAGALTVALAVRAGVPRVAPVVLAYWCGALVGSRWGPGLLLVGVAGGVVVQVAVGRGLPVGRPVAVAASMVALVLLAAKNLHGAAMVTGIVIAAVIGRQGTSARP